MATQRWKENNQAAGTTTVWDYDAADNITRRRVYPYTTGSVSDLPADALIEEVNYVYNDSQWGDLLKAYNGRAITYDAIGNPTNDFTWRYTWQHGRQVASMIRIGQPETWNFTYNADGLRTQKTNGTRTYQYTYLGDQLSQMTVDGHTLYFTYDTNGSPISLTYDGANYYYVTNLQGDILALLDTTGTEVVRYTYDAWGNILTTTGTLASSVGYYNPLRYRGYVYDTETQLYYLQSRYYNPRIGRFINADGLTSTGQGLSGNNMFAYCGDNPISNTDATGMLHERSAGLGGGFCMPSGGGGGGGGGRPFWSGGGYQSVYAATFTAAALAPVIINQLTTVSMRNEMFAVHKSSAKSEVYTYAEAVKYFPNLSKRGVPHVHHIVPKGSYSGRGEVTRIQIQEMQTMLKNAGINRYIDPMNLTLVSAATHYSLHTNAYFAHVHSYIAATDGSAEEIYAAPFQLRLKIAAWDAYAGGLY